MRWDEICYVARNAFALRQLGFYSQGYLAVESFSPFWFALHYTMFQITSCQYRKYNMPNTYSGIYLFFFLFSFFPTSWEFLPLKIKGYFAKLSKYNKMILGKTSISVTVSKKSCLNFLHMIIFRKSWELRYLSIAFSLVESIPRNPVLFPYIVECIHIYMLCSMQICVCPGKLYYLARLFSRPTDISIVD